MKYVGKIEWYCVYLMLCPTLIGTNKLNYLESKYVMQKFVFSIEFSYESHMLYKTDLD